MTDQQHEQLQQYQFDAIDALPDPSELADGFEWTAGGDA